MPAVHQAPFLVVTQPTLSKTAACRELAILQTEAPQETEIVGGFFCKEEGTETEAKEGNGKLCAES